MTALPYHPMTKTRATVTEVGGAGLLLVISQDEDDDFVVGLYRELHEAPLAQAVLWEEMAETIQAEDVFVRVESRLDEPRLFVRVRSRSEDILSYDAGQTWEHV